MVLPLQTRSAGLVSAGRRCAMAAAGLLLTACTPTIKVATDEPITINLNVNIKHEILVKVERELDTLFGPDSELF
jgi:hypothetical protein